MQNDRAKIKNIKAREILDSRGNPTIEVELKTDLGKFLASVPSGASTGKYEAVELRDGGKRYDGKGVLKAVKNINKIIAPKLIGRNATRQKEIDNLMLELDGTENKSRLGANATCGVSLAVCRAGAAAENLAPYKYISQLHSLSRFSGIKTGSFYVNNTFSTIVENVLSIPKPCFNVINGGAHAGNELDVQEFMLVPQGISFSQNLQIASEIYHQLKEILARKFGKLATNLGDEGGFAPPIKSAAEAIELILEAAKKLNYDSKIKLILDVAASQFFKNGRYKMKIGVFTRESIMKYYEKLIKNYPILGLEDPFAENDWEGWKKLKVKSEKLKVLVIGDDLLVTNPKRLKEAQRKKACNAMILKVNQIGTVSEALEAAKLAKSYGWKIFVKNRSGETNDDFIADLAVGIGADGIMAGAPARGERLAKYNRLLKIEIDANNRC
ncbi:phosphopyruvate hydratase [Patescibacteria group bacterium]|nr:phosphopyruvate hydratase [Patescibacteria group bacterium]MBU4480877.1 phosphopyruvate hydratase [Patescibacteria group bacterium]